MPDETPTTSRQAIAYLTRLVGRRKLASVAAWMVLASATEGVGLLLLVPITHIVAGGAVPGLGAAWTSGLVALPLWLLLGGFVALVAFRAAIMFHVRGLRAKMGLELTRQLRSTVQRAVVGADWRWISGERSGDYGALVVGQAERLGALVDRAIELVTVSITVAVLLVTAFWLAWDLTLLTVAMASVVAVVTIVVRSGKRRWGDEFNFAYERLQRHVAEGFAHLRAARIAGAEQALTDDFDRVTAALQDAEWRYMRASQRANFTLQVTAAVILAAIVYAGLRVLFVPLALFVPVLAIFLRIAPLAGTMQEAWRAWRFCQPALDGLLRTVAAARRAAEPQVQSGAALAFTDAIVLKGVGVRFSARPAPVFSGFDLVIPKGAVVAVAGPSGSGKSTLADLLSGLVEPDEGSITLDRAPLQGEARIRWRRQVAYVEQAPYLIDGTIADNIAWGMEGLSRAAMEKALASASAHFVRALPDGLDTMVGEVGRELSGGERQRISLARALVRDPSLVILDEATSALDTRNEAAIAQTISHLRGERTFVILGHRPALHGLADIRIDLGEKP